MSPIVPAPSHQSVFVGDVLTLLTGTTVAQIITLLASPIITRLYGPETFGLLAIFISITNIISVISCMRYDVAIMLPNSDEEASNVLGVSLFCVVIVSIVSIPFFILSQPFLVQFLNAPQLGQYFWMFPFAILASGLFLALNSWNTRTKHFSRLSIVRVISSCTTTGIQLVEGSLGHATGGILIGANILGQFVSTLTLGIQIMRDNLSFFIKNITRKKMIEVIKRYINFPKYDIWATFLNSLSWQIPIFLLAYFFSTTIVGYYSLGMMVIQLPMSLIGGSIGQVFFQRANEAKFENTLHLLVENVFIMLFKLGIFPMMILLMFGEFLFTVFFGPQWGTAGIYVQILSIWAFLWFISSPISLIISVLEKQSWGLRWNILVFSTRFMSLMIGGILGNVLIALALFSISGVIVYGYFIVKTMEYSHIPIKYIVGKITSTAFQIICGGIILFILTLLKVNSFIVVIFASVFGLFYYVYLLRTDPFLYRYFIQNIWKTR